MAERVTIDLSEEQYNRLEQLARAETSGNKSELVRNLIEERHSTVFGEDCEEVEYYSPFHDRGPLSSEELSEVMRRYESPAVHPDHVPATVPRDTFAKQQLVAAVVRWHLAVDEDMSGSDIEWMVREILRVASDSTVQQHVKGVREIHDRYGVEADNAVLPIEPADEVEDLMGMTVEEKVEQLRAEIDREVPLDVYEARESSARDMMDVLDVRDPRYMKLEEAVLDLEERIEAADRAGDALDSES